ncbi:MAG: hypothetical protein VBE63_12840 [Lamprobacter sp.]|uniref:hypothetical protein n=1 Tax=Lamprobacter sp. TaxID=3100796 RepID=UPI002B264472|nr:hypothetical protein [Lamprobacter sp.]MEA3640815.1 hypothetical protein [Lamprobacter sp.]
MNAQPLIEDLQGDPEIAMQAALNLWNSAAAPVCAAQPDLCSAIRASVAHGNRSAAALLLLGYDTSTAATAALEQAATTDDTEMTRLQPWSEQVPVRLPADVALSRLGDPAARARIFGTIEAGDLASLAFLVAVLRDIDSPEVLQALSRTLNDDREIPVDPTGAPPAVRLLQDVATEAFITRLGLSVSFQQDANGHYSAAQRQEVLAQIKGSIPQ